MPRRRSRLAVLHVRDHRPAQGRHAHARGARGCELRLCRRGRSDCGGRCSPARGADEPWFGCLHDGDRGAARHQRHAGIELVRRRGGAPPVRCVAAHLDVRRSDHGEAAGRMPRRLQSRSHQDHHLGRRADVRRRRAQGDRAIRPTFRADLRSGRGPDDDHGSVAAGHRRPRPSALGGAARPGGLTHAPRS